MMNTISKGKLSEDFVVNHLKLNGMAILKRNYHSKYGEIDIVAIDSNFILFIEVKARKQKSMIKPAEAVNIFKIRKIIKTAQTFLMNFNDKLQPRFDVVEVEIKNSKCVMLNYIKNAFDLEYAN